MKTHIYFLVIRILSLVVVPFFLVVALTARIYKKRVLTKETVKVVWGTTSLTNYKHWSNSLVAAGWNSKSVVGQTSHHSSISDFDEVLFAQSPKDKSSLLKSFQQETQNLFRCLAFFFSVLTKTNLVVHSCEGLVFHRYNKGLFHYKIEFLLMILARIKIVVIPYGGDAHIYKRIRNPYWLAGLLTDYPLSAKLQNKIAKRVDFYVEKVHVFLPGSAFLDGFGRSDFISANTLCIDTELWCPIPRVENKHLVITHTPNHRNVKGTKSVIEAVRQLTNEGYDMELILLEGKTNEEVRYTLQSTSDIHVDQINSDAYALSAIEAMALGIPTIASFGGEIRRFFSEWSFAESCPIINANSECLTDVLRDLIIDKERRISVSQESREYVINYHSYEYFAKTFHEILVSKQVIKM